MTSRRAARRPVAALAAALATAAAWAAVPPSAGAPEDPEGRLEVDIDDLAPAVLTPGDGLTVSGTIVNDSEQDVTAPELELRMQRYAPISRTSLRQWMDPSTSSVTMQLAVENLGPIQAGSSASFTVEVAPEELGLSSSSSSWGPHGVELSVSDTGGTTLYGVDRSMALWYPDVPVERTPVHVLVPVTAGARERAEAEDDGGGVDAVAEAAEPRIGGLLDAVDQPGVTLAVDPELLPAEIETTDPDEATEEPTTDEATEEESTTAEETTDEETSPEPTDDATETPTDEETGEPEEPTAAETILDSLLQHADGTGRSVAVLPRADADIAALAHSRAGPRLASTTTEALTTARAAGFDESVLAWPATQNPDRQTFDAAAAAGMGTAVLPVSAVSPLDELTYTPTGRADLAAGGGRIPAILVDDDASSVLSGTMPPAPGSTHGPVELNGVDSRQLLLADTAVISRERPSDPRAVNIAAPRAYGGDVDELAESLEALLAAPWVAPATLEQIRSLDVPDLDRNALPERAVRDRELTRRGLDRMNAALSRAETFAGATEEPELMLDPLDVRASSLLSAAWRRDPQGREGVLDGLEADVAALDERLGALESSSVLVINSSVVLPVHVRNDLPSDATVQVSLESSDDLLQANGPVTVTVPSESQAAAEVPVTAVGSGDVTVRVQLLTPDGQPIGTPSELEMRVRADWESVGTAVVAGVLGVVLVFGLVRTVRGGRRMEPAAPDEVGA
ncbi:DUF6049 family protein [Georgenia alba]|uniref:DUF6049 family protein n=1 Tax=Georgenia alba TaxID=2233858 RepID=A0ABW2Q4K0_9MICO